MESAQAPLRSSRIGRLLPVYPLTEGLTADRFRALIERVLPSVRLWPEPLPRVRRDARQGGSPREMMGAPQGRGECLKKR